MTIGSTLPRRLIKTVGLLGCRRFSSVSTPIVDFNVNRLLNARQRLIFTHFPQQFRFLSVSSRSNEASKAEEDELLDLFDAKPKPVGPNAENSTEKFVSHDDDDDIDLEDAAEGEWLKIPEYDWEPTVLLSDLAEYLHSLGYIHYGTLIVGSAAAVRLLQAYSYYKAERGQTNKMNNFDKVAAFQIKRKSLYVEGDFTEREKTIREQLAFAKEKGIPLQRTENRGFFYRTIPIVTQMMVSYRLAVRNADGMSTEGFLWFTDLTVADPTMVVFRIVLPFATLFYVWMKLDYIQFDKTKLTALSLLLGIVCLPLSLLVNHMPMSLTLCCTTNLALAYLFLFVFRFPPTRRLLKLDKRSTVPYDAMLQLHNFMKKKIPMKWSKSVPAPAAPKPSLPSSTKGGTVEQSKKAKQ